MRSTIRSAAVRGVMLASVAGSTALLSSSGGCTSSQFGGALDYIGYPFFNGFVGRTATGTLGGEGTSSTFGDDNRGNVDPCSEPVARKFVRIAMRNLDGLDYIHYFVVMVAFIQTDTTAGAVCAADVELYTDFGYTLVEEGQEVPFGNFCVPGPALIYYHADGQFRTGGGTDDSSLGSAIAPAQGTSPTYDNFFGSAGRQVPVPDVIIFHNPGTGAGAALKVAANIPDPCNVGVIFDAPGPCQQDSFYYVDQNDRLAGSNRVGQGSAVRVPNEIQGTGCDCAGTGGVALSAQQLAPSASRASNARCNEFFRGGLIDYAFLRNDTNPPMPQLVWRVTDSGGTVAHNFDPRANIP